MKNLIAWVNKLNTNNKKVYIAGGAPLDIHLGRQPRDIDIFIKEKNCSWLIEDHGIVDKIEGQPCVIKSREESSYGCERLVYWTTIDGYSIDIITIANEVKSVKDLIEGFDFDICEAWVDNIGDKEWSISLTATAKKAIKSRNIEYRNGDHINRHFNKEDKNKEKRIARYKEKFPEFKIWEQL